MKKSIFLSLFSLLWIIGFAQSKDYDEVANRIVNQSLEVKKGEQVLIHASSDVQAIAEAVYVAVYKAGGLATIRMNFPDADLRISKEVKLEYLAQPNYADAVTNRMFDCVINIDSNTDPDRWKDITPEVRKAFHESGQARREMNLHDRVRVVSLGQSDGIPTPQVAKVFGADYKQMKQNFWEAIAVDHAKLKTSADEVTAKLVPGSKVKVTTPYGTNIDFLLANNTPMASCGSTMDQQRNRGNSYSWLPAGDVFTAINPTSANGTIVMPAYYMGSEKITNLKVIFKNGVIQGISADQDVTKLEERILAFGAENAMLSSIDLGLNPQSKVIGDYRSFEMAGMVTIGVGSNIWAGGDYNGKVDYFFHLKDATLEVGNKNVVKDGALTSR